MANEAINRFLSHYSKAVYAFCGATCHCGSKRCDAKLYPKQRNSVAVALTTRSRKMIKNKAYRMKQNIVISTLLLFATICVYAKPQSFCFQQHERIGVSALAGEQPVAYAALEMVAADFRRVLNAKLIQVGTGERIIVGTLNDKLKAYCDKTDIEYLQTHREGFVLKVLSPQKLLVVGSDSHGTAYALLELSRLAGVSPWEWWADVAPKTIKKLELPVGFVDRQQR